MLGCTTSAGRPNGSVAFGKSLNCRMRRLKKALAAISSGAPPLLPLLSCEYEGSARGADDCRFTIYVLLLHEPLFSSGHVQPRVVQGYMGGMQILLIYSSTVVVHMHRRSGGCLSCRAMHVAFHLNKRFRIRPTARTLLQL